jgi:hypothetical protein
MYVGNENIVDLGNVFLDMNLHYNVAEIYIRLIILLNILYVMLYQLWYYVFLVDENIIVESKPDILDILISESDISFIKQNKKSTK